ncbi:MAG: SsrA-binding protein SmpB [Campylobacterota bacterium]|nr:SsrA-binding protein SmpB [Campylobacterota bacterium]
MATKKTQSKPKSFLNKKAYHDYIILDTYEAGVVFQGSEVKAIRAGRVNIKDSFIRIIKGEVFWFNAHISHLDTAHTSYRPNERRERKLLLHNNQIAKLFEKISKDGMAIVPIKLYFNARNKLKLQIATAQGKKLYDKREDLKRKSQERDMKIAIKNFR